MITQSKTRLHIVFSIHKFPFPGMSGIPSYIINSDVNFLIKNLFLLKTDIIIVCQLWRAKLWPFF